MLWRLVLSPRIASSLIEIQTLWTLADVMEAHVALDAAEDIEIAISEALSEPR
jgi:hypothetical protein